MDSDLVARQDAILSLSKDSGLELRIGHLYPRLMNLYGDRGNLICLERRARWRGIAVTITELEIGDPLDPEAFDLLFIGGAQDKEQRLVAHDLREVKGAALKAGVEKGLVVLAICGGFQLLGRYYRPAQGEDLMGLGILDVWTEHPGGATDRCIGNIALDWEGKTLVGFENHGGRTYLGPDARPLGQVIYGYGNNAQDGSEGAVYQNCFGSYLHGSFLPKNPEFADHLLGLALARRYGPVEMAPLNDRLEREAKETALRQARAEASARRPWLRRVLHRSG